MTSVLEFVFIKVIKDAIKKLNMRILFLIVSFLSVSLCAYSQQDDSGISLTGYSSMFLLPSMNQNFSMFEQYIITNLTNP